MRRLILAAVVLAAGAVLARRLKGRTRSSGGAEAGGAPGPATYTPEPDQLPNEPDRPVSPAPPPGAE